MKIYTEILQNGKAYCIDVIGREKKYIYLGILKNRYTLYDAYSLSESSVKIQDNGFSSYVIATIVGAVIANRIILNALNKDDFNFSIVYLVAVIYLIYLIIIFILTNKMDSNEVEKKISKVEHEKVTIKLEPEMNKRLFDQVKNLLMIFSIAISIMLFYLAAIVFKAELLMLASTGILLRITIHKYIMGMANESRYTLKVIDHSKEKV